MLIVRGNMNTIAFINSYPKFDALFAQLTEELGVGMKIYSGTKPMADELNKKSLGGKNPSPKATYFTKATIRIVAFVKCPK